MYLLVGDDEHSSEESSEAQLKRNETWLTEFKADQKYLGFCFFSFASQKNEAENSYFRIHDNTQQRIKMDSWVCFIWFTFSPMLWPVSLVFQPPSDRVSAFQSELDTSNAHDMFQLWFVFEACPQANRTASTENKKNPKAHSPSRWQPRGILSQRKYSWNLRHDLFQGVISLAG